MSYSKVLAEFNKEYTDEKMWSIVKPSAIKKVRVNASTRKGATMIRKLMAHIKECEECGKGKYLSVHHIDKCNRNNNRNNLVKLCIQCHMKKHEGEAVREIMNKRYRRSEYV